MLGMTHETPGAAERVGEGGGRGSAAVFDSDYSVLSRRVIALEQYRCSCLDPLTRNPTVLSYEGEL